MHTHSQVSYDLSVFVIDLLMPNSEPHSVNISFPGQSALPTEVHTLQGSSAGRTLSLQHNRMTHVLYIIYVNYTLHGVLSDNQSIPKTCLSPFLVAIATDKEHTLSMCM